MTDVAYITYEHRGNPDNLPSSYIAEAIINPPSTMPSPWVTVTQAAYAALIADQQEEMGEAAAGAYEAVRRQERVEVAWQAAWEHINKWYDNGGMLRFVAWTSDPNASSTGKTMIGEITQWIDGVMATYLFYYKPTLLAGGSIEINYDGAVGSAPYTFTQVIVAINTPWFVTQPTDENAILTQTATFAAATGGLPTRTHQWQKSTNGGSTWADIEGATDDDYTTPAVSYDDDGHKFRCVVSTAVGSTVSNAVTLDVTP